MQPLLTPESCARQPLKSQAHAVKVLEMHYPPRRFTVTTPDEGALLLTHPSGDTLELGWWGLTTEMLLQKVAHWLGGMER